MAKQVSLEQIIKCGVNQTIAAGILPQINQCLVDLSPVDCWQYFSRELLKPNHPFPLHELLYQTAFAEWNSSQGAPPVWLPSEEQIEASNIGTLMKELEIADYDELHAWSSQNRAEFWEVIIRRLNICLSQKYTQVVDLSQGIESPQWLVNARLNIVESCFQAPTDDVAIIWQQERGSLSTLTYGELEVLTNRVSNSLLNFGCLPGDRLAIAMPMTAESVAIYLGIIKAGCVVVAIADSLAAEEIATRLHLSQAKAIFTQDYILRAGKQLPLYNKVIEANPVRAIVLPHNSSLSMKLRQQDLSWHEFLSPQEKFAAIAAQPDTYTNILFSSGTTGEPKAIPWTQTTPIKCATDAHLHHDIHPQEVVAWPTNLGWMMGPWLIYASLINRATIALYYGAPTGRGFGQFVRDAGVNMLGVVPSLVNSWKVTGCMQGLDWSAIKAFSSTGECSTPQDMLFLMSLAGYKPIIEYCGGTEIGGSYLTGTLVQPCTPSIFTTPALGLDLAIFDENDDLADQGEAFIIPPSIGLSNELLNKDHHQVYFADTPSPNLRRHGDRLERLSNSGYRAQGRADDTMNLAGIKVSSAEIERVLNTVEGVRETAAIAVSPPQGGMSQLVIYAVVAPQVQTDKDSLMVSFQTAIKQHLNPLFKISDLEIIEALPRTASNKVMRRVLRDQYRNVNHKVNILTSLKVLLSSIVDYAGLFPPAKLNLREAIANYIQYHQTQENWLLGRFVIPVSRLAELETLLADISSDNTTTSNWSLSVILSEDWASEVTQIQAFNYSNQLKIASVEFKPLPSAEIKQAIDHLSNGMESFFEIPLSEDFAPYLTVLQGKQASAKIRTGGLTAKAFPNVDRLCRFIFASAAAQVPFKATAGLHHPLPGKYPVSYETKSFSTSMQGFLNLSILTALVYGQKLTQSEAQIVLQESSPSSFQFQDDNIAWKDRHLNLAELQQARQYFFRSFGSCSFQEPLDELRELQLL